MAKDVTEEPAAAGGGTPVPPPSHGDRPGTVRRSGRIVLAGGLALLVLLLMGLYQWSDRPSEPLCCPPPERLLRSAAAAPDADRLAAVGASVYLLVARDGDGNEVAVGSAWVIDAEHLVGSAVAFTTFEHLGDDEWLAARPPAAVAAGRRDQDVRIVSVMPHPGALALTEILPDDQPATAAAGQASLAYDLAIFTVAPGSQLAPPLPVASASELMVGDGLGAVAFRRSFGGAPDGVEQAGISGRLLSTGDLFGMPPLGEPPTLLLHDLAFSASAAGGPLLDGSGQVVGVLGGTAFVLGQEGNYPLSGVAGTVDLLVAMTAGEADAALARSRGLWPLGRAVLADEPGATDRYLEARALVSAGLPLERQPDLREDRNGRLGAAVPPFAGPVALETFSVEGGLHLLLLEGPESWTPIVALYLDGTLLAEGVHGGGGRAVTMLQVPRGGSLTVALLGALEGIGYELRLVSWEQEPF